MSNGSELPEDDTVKSSPGAEDSGSTEEQGKATNAKTYGSDTASVWNTYLIRNSKGLKLMELADVAAVAAVVNIHKGLVSRNFSYSNDIDAEDDGENGEENDEDDEDDKDDD
jgi:hypothetical protein